MKMGGRVSESSSESQAERKAGRTVRVERKDEGLDEELVRSELGVEVDRLGLVDDEVLLRDEKWGG